MYLGRNTGSERDGLLGLRRRVTKVVQKHGMSKANATASGIKDTSTEGKEEKKEEKKRLRMLMPQAKR